MTANLVSEVFSPFRWIRALQRLKHKITWTTHPLKHGKWCNQIRRELKHNNNNKKWNHSVLWIPHNYLPLLKGTVHPKMSNPVIIYSWCSKPVYGTQNKIEKSLECACVYESHCGPMLFLLWLYRQKRKMTILWVNYTFNNFRAHSYFCALLCTSEQRVMFLYTMSGCTNQGWNEH